LTSALSRLASLESTLRAVEGERDQLRGERDQLRGERDKLREAWQAVKLELELLKKRLFVAKAERVDVDQLELEFAKKLAELDALSKRLEPVPSWMMATVAGGSSGSGQPEKPAKKTGGRRDVREMEIPEERIELVDDKLEGVVKRLGFEESYKLVWRRGGMVRLVVARAKYQVENPQAEQAQGAAPTRVVTTPMPEEAFPRLLAAPSLLAHVIVDKACDGLPLHRQQERFMRDGVKLDRSTMSRWLEDAGNTLGATLVEAARKHFMATAFSFLTDATGVLVQPLKSDVKKKHQPCRRGHFFVQLADKDFAFFEYVPRETSAAVAELFKGFAGYIQADAKSVYDVLYPPANAEAPGEDECLEVGCWCHCRRKYWEAAIANCAVSREALVRIQRIFENEEKWKGLSAEHLKVMRDERTRPLVDDFFAWATIEYAKVKDTRGLLRSALGYTVRQREALCRFLDDGRLGLSNNASERELRRIAVGRKAWLFCGSDDHAQAAAALFTLIATCKLHGLEPEAYLRDVLRLLAHWPKDRYLELCPHAFAATRARLDPVELAQEVGCLTVPPAIVPPPPT
jgi:transposase